MCNTIHTETATSLASESLQTLLISSNSTSVQKYLSVSMQFISKQPQKLSLGLFISKAKDLQENFSLKIRFHTKVIKEEKE